VRSRTRPAPTRSARARASSRATSAARRPPGRDEASRFRAGAAALALLLVAGCATRPVNAPLADADRRAGYRYETRAERPDNDPSTVIVLAFSGGGMRAAAFSFGVLEELRRTQVAIGARRARLLDEVDLVTGVSGGASRRSRTACTARSCSTTTTRASSSTTCRAS
jgi:predicted acylesterase/phospholipase RssA